MDTVIEWCRRNAPTLWKELSDEELKEKMREQYDKYIESYAELYTIADSPYYCRLEGRNYNVYLSNSIMLISDGIVMDQVYVVFKEDECHRNISMYISASDGTLSKVKDTCVPGGLSVRTCIEAVEEVLGENPLDQLLDNNRDWSRIEEFRKEYLKYKRTNRESQTHKATGFGE